MARANASNASPMYLLKRGTKYLNERYQWQAFPCPFPEWQFGAVLEMAMQFRDRPKQIGEMTDGTIENVVWSDV